MKRTVFLLFLMLSICKYCALAGVSIRVPSTVNLQQSSSETINITLSSPLNSSMTLFFNITYESRNVSLIIELPEQVVVPAGNTSLLFEVQAKGVGQVTVYLSTNDTRITSLTTRIRFLIVRSNALFIINQIIGWIYFLAWSVSFYPQAYENWRRRSVVGLNFDFLALNLTGFIAYSVFNVGLFWVAYIQRGGQKVSKVAIGLLVIGWSFALVSLFVAVAQKISWLDYLYYFSYIKLGVTLVKYIPQAHMNYRRKSTEGWSIGNVLLDFTGGSFSLVQMFLEAYNNERPVAPPVFMYQKDKAVKRSAEGSSTEDGEEEKTVGFRLKPPTLIHGQAPSAGVPSPKPKEAQRSILRPPVLQPPPVRTPLVNNVCNSSSDREGNLKFEHDMGFDPEARQIKDKSEKTEDKPEEPGTKIEAGFIFEKLLFELKYTVVQNSLDSSLNTDGIQKKNSEESNYFLQYSNSSTQKPDTTNSMKFVFGQNMLDRVMALPKFNKESAGGSTKPNSEMGLFSQLSSVQQQTPERSDHTKESLEESAARHEAHKPQKCLLEPVEVRTGEESESNVLQMQCKLFVFEMTSQSWLERGFMRTQGSLRVILNTKLWPQMQVDKASDKSLRITALDSEEQGVKVFLISSSSKDAAQLFAALHHRILALRSISGQEAESQAALPDGELMRFSDDDESRTPPITATTTAGNPETGVCPSTSDA
ncbi:hypothetical protein DNTS_015151 [Danionella cerebrum]|uniref:RanBD1 domain-containing protein n=1 Tax=Danionella cerebrum TaxID=2873325 RepID=A0A553RGV3_9TELE|nr:hypothetical protein DNTS_015151 [Danionella translucida]